jgi:hypothetical protein
MGSQMKIWNYLKVVLGLAMVASVGQAQTTCAPKIKPATDSVRILANVTTTSFSKTRKAGLIRNADKADALASTCRDTTIVRTVYDTVTKTDTLVKTDTVFVNNQAPVAKFTQACTLLTGTGWTCVFDASTSTDDNGIDTYRWAIPGTSPQAGVIVTAVLTPTDTGTVTLEVTDRFGLSTIATQKVVLVGNPNSSQNVITFAITDDTIYVDPALPKYSFLTARVLDGNGAQLSDSVRVNVADSTLFKVWWNAGVRRYEFYGATKTGTTNVTLSANNAPPVVFALTVGVPPTTPPPPPPPTPSPVSISTISTQPSVVVAGSSILGSLRGNNGSSTSNVDVTVALPHPTFTIKWVEGNCCILSSGGYYFYKGEGDIAFRVTTTTATPPGDYTVVISGKDRLTGDVGVLNVPIKVVTLPAVVTTPKVAPPALPALTKYTNDMRNYGTQYCNSTLSAGVESGVWYYDGILVYHKASKYLNDPTFITSCAQNVKNMYIPYVVNNNGSLPGYRVFSQGLRRDFEVTGDTVSRKAAILLAKGLPLQWQVDQVSSREVAYQILAMVDAERLGVARNPKLADLVNVALGHIDQWTMTKNGTYARPFMFALTSEALIRYYELTGDPRVIWYVKTGADWMWANTWVDASEAFRYTDRVVSSGGTNPAPDLNNLIAPVYGWLYSVTGDETYRTQGDKIFSGGVKLAWLGNGKQYSQNYRWSFDYLTWTGR